MKRVQAIYDTVHTALWALLVAFVLFFVLFVLPQMPEIHLQAEMQRTKTIASEDMACCAKLGMGEGMPKHDECLFEIGKFRSEVEQRVSAESDIF